MSLVIECASFTVTPIPGGLIRLDIVNPSKKAPAEVYGASQACERLGELLGRTVSRWHLNYWRNELGLPYQRLGPKKFTYSEKALTDWVTSKHGSAL